MVKNGIVKTNCAICHCDCGVLAHVKNGTITKIEGDPDSPTSRGGLCPKGWASLEFLNHPDRLRHPLRRAEDRGEGKWHRLTWEQALDHAAEQLEKIGKQYTRCGVLFMAGSDSQSVKKAAPAVWPRDLSAGSTVELEWGADPAEVDGD